MEELPECDITLMKIHVFLAEWAVFQLGVNAPEMIVELNSSLHFMLGVILASLKLY